MITGKHGKETEKEDKRVLRLLRGTEEEETYQDFVQDAGTHNPTTQWGRDRRASADKDLFLKGNRAAWEHTQQLYSKGLDDAVIAKIDAERGASPANDVAVGVIRTSQGYKCSVGTPDGYKKATFMTQLAAETWVEAIREKYKEYCR